jgi:hypothetical protein
VRRSHRACGGPALATGARTRWHGTRSLSIRSFPGGEACNPAISRPGMQLPLRDNTLRAIPPRPQTKKTNPGTHHSPAAWNQKFPQLSISMSRRQRRIAIG